MNNIDFISQPNGFPLEANLLNYMQSNYVSAIKALAASFGNAVIVSGISKNGSSRTEGWIYIDGDFVQFLGGPETTTFYVETTTIQKANSNGTLIDRYFTKVAKFGTNANFPTYNFADLKRISTQNLLQTSLFGLVAENAIMQGCAFSFNSGTGVFSVGAGVLIINNEVLSITNTTSQAAIYAVKDEDNPNEAKWVTSLPTASYIKFDNKGSSQYAKDVICRAMSSIGEIKMLSSEYATLFDNTGLGLAKFHGWAICNGSNGTVDMSGRFPMGFDQDNAVGNSGGDSEIVIGANGNVGQGEYGLVQRSMPGGNVTVTSVDANGSGNEPNVASIPQRIPMQGSGEPIEFKPSFVSLLFIQRI